MIEPPRIERDDTTEAGDSRRTFFRQLAAAGAPVVENRTHKNRRAHHKDKRLYMGPMAIPQHVADAIATDPQMAKSTHRQLLARYNDLSTGIVYRFRCPVPEHGGMVGELVQTLDGVFRVHCWSSADPADYKSPSDLIAGQREGR